nr:immunoglobulin heavy chain junction region [Mus musculus]
CARSDYYGPPFAYW